MSRVDYYFEPAIVKAFHIFNIGAESCLPSYQFGPHLRDNYVIHYVIAGGGVFEREGVRYEMEPGQFFLIHPEEVTLYRADQEKPWTYFWLGFNGEATASVLESLGLVGDNRVGRVTDHLKVTQQIEALLELCLETPHNSLSFQGLAQQVLGELQVGRWATYKETIKKNPHIEKLLYAVHNNFGRTDYSVQELADTLNLTAPYLTELTKKELGQTPSELLRNYRLEKANYLLLNSSMLVGEVALAVGYESPLSFSRAYKQRYHVAPSKDKS